MRRFLLLLTLVAFCAIAVAAQQPAEQRAGNRRDVRDRSLGRIGFIFADDPKRLLPPVVPKKSNRASELHRRSVRNRQNEI